MPFYHTTSTVTKVSILELEVLYSEGNFQRTSHVELLRSWSLSREYWVRLEAVGDIKEIRHSKSSSTACFDRQS
jgi:hypothetical protein